MKKSIYLFLISLALIFLLPKKSVTQASCTVTGAPDLSYFDLSSAGTHPAYTVKVYFHIVRQNDGTGGYDPSRLPLLVDLMDGAFNSHGIFFDYECALNFLDDSERVLNGASSNESEFCEWHQVTMPNDGLNIFIIDFPEAVSQFGFRGRADAIPGNFIIMRGNSNSSVNLVETETLIHEMGHIFGLLHLFHGCTQNPNIWPDLFGTPCCPFSESCYDCDTGNVLTDPGECAEDSTNGATCGDYIPDTAPSHIYAEQENVSVNCILDPSDPIYNDPDQKPQAPQIFDPEGNPYDPDFDNYMSVGWRHCRNFFSPNQATVMQNHIASHPTLQGVVTQVAPFACNCSFTDMIYLKGINNWSDVVTNYSLDPLELSEREVIVEEELIMDVDYTFSGVDFQFASNAKLTIPTGRTVQIKESNTGVRSVLDACSIDWDGIEVKSYGQLNIESSDLLNAVAAIQLVDYGKSYISDNTLFSSCQTGIKRSGFIPNSFSRLSVDDSNFERTNIGIDIAGRVSVSSFDNNLFDECFYGIALKNTQTQINLVASDLSQSNFFNECTRGIYMEEAGARIYNNEFSSCHIGIELSQCNIFTDIVSNDFEYDKSGIWSDKSVYRILDNDFTKADPQQTFFEAAAAIVSRNGSNGSRIVANDIQAIRRGIALVNETNVEVVDVTINVDSPHNFGNSAGVAMFFSDCKVHSNTITTTKADGIQIISGISGSPGVGGENTINNNTIHSIDGYNRAGIRVSGSTDYVIHDNLITGDLLDGIQFVNSGDNWFVCNDITSNVRGMFVANNSDIQELLGNTTALYESVHFGKVNLITRSVLGVQKHHGNIFHGDGQETAPGVLGAESYVESQFLSPSQVTDSRFIFDDIISGLQPDDPLLPQSWDPSGLFVPLLDANNETYICSGLPGDNFEGPILEDDALCTYLADLSGYSGGDPDKYWINLYHLYKAYLWQSNYGLWPQCLKEQWDNELLCGIKELVQMEVSLFQKKWDMAFSGVSETDQVNYIINAIDEGDTPEDIESELVNLESTRISRQAASDTELTDQEGDLATISCTGSLMENWAEIYGYLVSYLQGNAPGSAVLQSLQTTAAECASGYGESVHWAQGILMEYDTTLYNNLDVCIVNRGEESTDAASQKQYTSRIYPNPSSHMIYVELSYKKKVDLRLINAQGQEVLRSSGTGIVELVVEPLPAGIYLIEISRDQNVLESHKVIIE